MVVTARDIMGRLVDANIDPAVRISATMSVLDVVGAALAYAGIKTIYCGDELNISAQTGAPKPSTNKTVEVVKIQNDSAEIEVVVVGANKSLNTLQQDQVKPQIGEGVDQYVDRILKRHGLIMRAAADGSGVVIGKPIYTDSATMGLIHRNQGEQLNNVLSGSATVDWSEQPSMIIASGFGGGKEFPHNGIKVICINELLSGSESSQAALALAALKKRYPAAKILPSIQALVNSASASGFGAGPIAPVFMKDDDSKNIEQLSAFVRREMSKFQMKALEVRYAVDGWSQNDSLWTTNTMVSVDDDRLGIHEPLWLSDRAFHKTKNGGTTCDLRLIRPYTLVLE